MSATHAGSSATVPGTTHDVVGDLTDAVTSEDAQQQRALGAEPTADALVPSKSATQTSPRIRVAVVCGGRSGEHSISCATAAGVLSALDRQRFDVVPVGITPEGQWLTLEDDPQVLALDDARPPAVIGTAPAGGAEIALRPSGGVRSLVTPADPSVLSGIDVVLPLLHGPYGEDGTIQGLLEMLDIPYVGCGVLASAAGMDKQVTKVVLQAAGIPTAPYVVVHPRRWLTERECILHACQALTYPLFVKPARAGSSLGITKVERPEDLAEAIETAREVDPKVLVESGIEGREIEVAVLGGRDGQEPRVAEPGEIVMDAEHGAGEFYDYETKYLAHDAVQMVCPARLSREQSELLTRTAIDVFEALGGEGLMRVDFFLTPHGEAVVNEVNTMPGFTPFSMYPYMWQVSGLSYTDLVSELIDLALSRPRNVNR